MAGKRCFKIAAGSVIMLLSDIVAAAPPSDDEVANAWSRLPNSFRGVSCKRLPWLPEAVSVVCLKDDRIETAGSIEFSTPPMDHEALIDLIRKKNSKIPGFEIVSSNNFDIEGAPKSVNVHVVYKSLFGEKKYIWISWADSQITRVLVNGASGALPTDMHDQVGKAFLGGAPIIKATQKAVTQ